jgi:capsular polysaccharide transport system permease protein
VEGEDTDLEIDAGDRVEPKRGTALARVRAVSLALSDAARHSRISSRRAASLRSGGFENRRGAKFTRYLLIASLVVVFVIPTGAAIAYFGFIAANQYVAEAEFTVSAGESPLRDGIASLSGIPSQLILQDTQIITNFLDSREMVDKLQQRIGIRQMYSRDGADFFTRFNPEKPVERLVKFWKHVSHASIKLPGGLVKFSVRAFTPHDAKLVADTTLKLCDDLVNSLNTRINADAVALAQIELQRASERLAKTLGAQEVERNTSGILETSASAAAISGLLKQLRGTLLDLSGAYDTQLKYLNSNTPQMQESKARIDVLGQQIAKLEGQLTKAPGSALADNANGDETIAAAMTRFGSLDVQRKADEELYTDAATALEHARIAAEFKMIYLKVYVQPSLPQESEYPERGLDIFIVAVASLTLWGVLVALGAVVRDNMA